MRTKILILLLALFALPSGAADLITRWLVITNAPIGNTNSVTLNGSVRTYTNTVSGAPATLIAQTNVIGWAATNTANQLTTYRVSFGHLITVGTNFVAVRGAVGENLTLSINACCFGFVTNSTQSVAVPTFLVRVPLTTEAATNQTSIASLLVKGLSDSSTNAFATNSTAISNALVKGASPLQTLNSPFQAFGRFSVNSNFFATNGFTSALTNINPVTSNLVNYGKAIRSEGSGGNSLQVGSNATASGALDVALGNSALANGPRAFVAGTGAIGTNSDVISIGTGARVTNSAAIGIGSSAKPTGGGAVAIGFDTTAALNAVAIGNESAAPAESALAIIGTASGIASVSLGVATATANYAVGIGYLAAATHLDSAALGKSAATTDTNQIRLGTAADKVSIPGALEAAAIRNAALVGTNAVNGVLGFQSTSISSVAAGHNVIDSITNTVLYLTGSPGVAWTLGGFTGAKNANRHLIVVNQTGFDVTIQNESGTAPTASDRILTYAGANGVTNVSVVGNGVMEFTYSTSASRWILRSPSVDVIATATNAVAFLDGSATNLNVYQSGSKVALTVNQMIGSATNASQILSTNGTVIAGVNSNATTFVRALTGSTANSFQIETTNGAATHFVRSNGAVVSSNLVITPFGPEIGVPHRLVILTNDVTVTNTTSETSLIAGVGLGTYTIPANYLTPGMTLHLHFNGKFTTPVSPGAVTLSAKLGSSIVASNISNINSSQVNSGWKLDVKITCLLIGAGGTVKGSGSFENSDALFFGYYRPMKKGVASDTLAVDTTASQVLDFTITPGTTTTGFTTTGGYVLIVP